MLRSVCVVCITLCAAPVGTQIRHKKLNYSLSGKNYYLEKRYYVFQTLTTKSDIHLLNRGN